MFWSRIVFPEPEGPRITDLNGICRDDGIPALLGFVFLQLDRLDHWGSDAIIICHPSIIYK
jgi:hypothetical protein